MATVKVFTPNFKHITVKITPNMTLLEILEEACRRAELDAGMFDLKHHRTVLDLSNQFRFSGLPTNCELEMIEAKEPRKDVADNVITVLLQTEEHGRVEGNFKAGTTLMEIIEKLCPEESHLATNPVIIYMRTDVQGESLSSTSLKTLGLTSGRGLLRLIHKNAEQLKTQANVSGMLPIKPVAKQEPASRPAARQMEIRDLLQKAKQGGEQEPSSKVVADAVPGPSKASQVEPSESPMETIPENIPEARPKKRNVTFTKEDLERLEADTHRLDGGNTLLFSLDSVITPSDADQELPDSFFDVTAADLRLLLSQMKENVRSLDNAPLMTSKLRELEDAKKTLIQLQYHETLIRIQFPNRLVLQAVFKPIATVAEVKGFLRTFLNEDVGEFSLFTTPPKTLLDNEKRLVELHCVPQALIHFTGGSAAVDVIRPEFLDKLSTAAAADFLAAKIRGRIEMMETSDTGAPLKGAADENRMDTEPSNGDNEEEPKKRIVGGTFKVSSTVTTEKGALPKWFKPSK